MSTKRASVIVISDWLASAHAGAWTPFEAASAMKSALANEGYGVYPQEYIDDLRSALQDTLNMLRAAHMQCGVHHDGNKRVIKARAVLAIGAEALSQPGSVARGSRDG